MKKNALNCDWDTYSAASWRGYGKYLHPIRDLLPPKLEWLIGVETQKQKLFANTIAFLEEREAMNVLLWGARGMGKSSLIQATLEHFSSKKLRMVEVNCDDLQILPILMDNLRKYNYYFIIFCDDLSFEKPNKSYKALKSVLEGSLEQFPKNVLIYATSNRHHLIKELQSDNQTLYTQELHAQNQIDEKLSLSDRFGLSLGFYASSIEEYRKQVEYYFGKPIDDTLFSRALVFASSRGGKSGRVAKQFHIAFCNQLL
ncbi:hypothetical protein CCZ01_02960 [Helicobacter monodelphidis]|uniref:ATP-binding protein n=1 Tax=Helicobacter sp. 15-1451 TaxID=2004995 RepID=UPI000DCC30C6|nr:ATP-binding protein [Helicobacter sp. 15-1451]RAX58391.1 hypothetical protein CCZ01_02960 [Helicobacter sp. 15-1451]